MGQEVQTLEDLLRLNLKAICVGINPSPRSVEMGHYYQGPVGKRFLARLKGAGLLSEAKECWADDSAFSGGIGFTDLVKRPTARGAQVLAAEIDYGRALLQQKLREVRPMMVIFTFKCAAEGFFNSRIEGAGFIPKLSIEGASTFIMPGPYKPVYYVQARLNDLKNYVLPCPR